ncbi:MAG: CoA transferase [Deltaproteobacteria bacterium]|nr:CoA transferase [Deltaproteobacteria bacterium]
MAKQVLEGVKILDFSWALVGSITAKQLGDHGAQIVKIETSKRVDLARTDRQVSISKPNSFDDKPWFTHLNTSKYSMALNLKHPRSREVVDKLIQWADVVLENFTPGTMTKLGLDYESIKKQRPDIIMASGSVYGQTGPMAQEWGVDGTGNALSSRLYLTGWPDRGPVVPTSVPYGDVVLPTFIASAIIAALDYRRRTGKGQHIDAGMFEAIVHQTSPAIMDWVANRNLQGRTGNRSLYASPHGIFPCAGEDRWVAITVFTEDEWRALCRVMGNPAWSQEDRFSTLSARKENEDDLEAYISKWTRQSTPHEIMEECQAAGVPAGAVQNAEDLIEHDPQLKEREFLTPIEHPVLGTFGHPTPPYKLLRNKAGVRTSPCLGEHTFMVCTEFLNMPVEDFLELENEGVFV